MRNIFNKLFPAKKRHRMTGVELLGFRYTLRLDVKVIAEMAGCAVPSWYAWENGANPVPDKIAEFIDEIKADFDDCLASYTNMAREQSGNGRVAMRYYETFELYSSHFPKSSFLDWRINQAVAFRLLFEEEVYLVSAEKIEEESCGD